ncbi:MAG TPA: HisA/HisF-related TIM barrel protein, partial [Solirubrobacterales bacterium]|nr:HisA/HisF-related TIM barrel protein [Solirubrobacterales bacterium]
MILYPAIDILGGKAVRLLKGEYDQETRYFDDPADAARQWADGGA